MKSSKKIKLGQIEEFLDGLWDKDELRVGEVDDITNSTTGQKSWSGAILRTHFNTKTESLNQFVGLSGVQDIEDTKTFTRSPVVPNPTLDAHAVNKGWVNEVTKLNHARYQTINAGNLATNGFIEFNGTPDFTSDYITQRANGYEFEVSEGGFYEVMLSWRSAFGNTYFLEFEINGFSKFIHNFHAGGQVFQYTYREYLNEGDLFRISSGDEIVQVKCTLYIKKIN